MVFLLLVVLDCIKVYSPVCMLQDFRKGAIYRRMRHYSRAFERSQRRVAKLEQEQIANDTNLASVQSSLAKVNCFYSQILDSELGN